MFKKIKRHKMKRVFLLLVLVVIVMTNSFAQARKVMCTGETMFVEEYVVDSLREKGLVRQVSPIMPVVAENDPVIKNWLLESFHYFLPKDVVQLLKNYNDKWKYCFCIAIKFDSEGNISILKDIPGNTKAAKTRNLALIVLYAISKKEEKEAKIRGSDLVSLCQKHNCYDKNNFSKTFEEQKDFLKEGKSKSQDWTLKLTFEGEKNAKHLLESLSSAESED